MSKLHGIGMKKFRSRNDSFGPASSVRYIYSKNESNFKPTIRSGPSDDVVYMDCEIVRSYKNKYVHIIVNGRDYFPPFNAIHGMYPRKGQNSVLIARSWLEYKNII